MLTQGMNAVVVDPDRKTVTTLDLDLAHQIQQTVENTNSIIRADVLHIVFAALHALAKTIDGSGFDTCSIEKDKYTSPALWNLWWQSIQARVKYHITTSLAIIMMLFDASAKDALLESIRTQYASLRKTFHERSPDTIVIFENIQSWYTTQN